MTLDDFMNYKQLKALARRADRAKGEKRKRLITPKMIFAQNERLGLSSQSKNFFVYGECLN